MTDPQQPVPPAPDPFPSPSAQQSPYGQQAGYSPAYGQQPYAPQGYAQAGYAQPGYAQPVVAYGPPTNTLAIVALILGLLVPIGGIICGHIALGQIRRTGEAGHGLALAGAILGYVFTGLTILIVILYFVFLFVFLGTAAAAGGAASLG
jgi:hypothetical protein